MKNLQEVFNLYCSKNSLKPLLLKPFIYRDKVCATDAYALVYAEKNDVNIETGTDECDLDIDRVIPENQSLMPFYLDDLENELRLKIRQVDEFNPPKYRCSMCDGYGEQECDLGHVHECLSCHGTGYYDRPEPTGKKIADPEVFVELDGTVIKVEQLNRVLKAGRLLGAKEGTFSGDNIRGLFVFEKINIIVSHGIASDPIEINI